MFNRYLISLTCSIFLFAGCATSPSIQRGADARVNSEGLNYIEHTVMDEAWIKLDANFSQYSKMMIVGTAPQFSSVNESEARTTKFAELAVEEFRKALIDMKGYELTSEPGTDVLLMHGAIRNIELFEEAAGNSRTAVYVNELGSAELIIELRDSLTGELILIASDEAKIGTNPGGMERATEQTTWSAVRRQLASWATLLRNRLDALSSYNLGESA